MAKPILCVDFDGVIHSYTSPWVDEATIPDPPVPGAIKWLWACTEWFTVQIYSSRSKTEAGRAAMKVWLDKYLYVEFGPSHPLAEAITFAHEKPAAFLTVDDRAVTFDGDFNELDPAELRNFKPWNKR